VDSEEIGRENYDLGSTIRGLQGLVIPAQEHLYQFMEAMCGGSYAGYFGETFLRCPLRIYYGSCPYPCNFPKVEAGRLNMLLSAFACKKHISDILFPAVG